MSKTRFINCDGNCYLISDTPKNEFKQGFEFEVVSHATQNLFKILQKYNHLYTYVYKMINVTKLPLEWESKRFFRKDRLLVSILDMEKDLKRFKDHKRLKVFYNKGLHCANPKCDALGHYLLLTFGVMSENELGHGLHVDVFTKDLKLMTVDHILPKSKGGTYNLDNLRPMCETCNNKLGTTQAY